MKVINKLKYENFIVGNLNYNKIIENTLIGKFLPAGQYSFIKTYKNNLYLVRDPLGINKLFYSLKSNKLICANNINDILTKSIKLDKIYSCPPGHMININKKIIYGKDLSSINISNKFNISEHQINIKNKLKKYFHQLHSKHKKKDVVVCLSGGLDSTIILYFSKLYFKKVTATSFSYLSENEMFNLLNQEKINNYNKKLLTLSDDFRSASSIANYLKINFYPIFKSSKSVIYNLKNVLNLVQDWRDFNVHCAIVNLFIAENLRTKFDPEKTIILTGDLLNEFVCDYREETVGKNKYYYQPKISIEQRRRFYVRGLDAGDREIGVFNAFGYKVFQPFSILAGNYMKIPQKYLKSINSKRELNGSLLNKKILSLTSKAKSRAQVGGKDGGTLAEFDRLNINQKFLKDLWLRNLKTFDSKTKTSTIFDIIQFGKYKSDTKLKKIVRTN